ncbi:PPE domain-containing protein [Nocardia brasiliensis]|uniref:PPE domain-containing protein n=1 Tax=Nocardia brasiliensis TaxID=37326 RepID=A0A6G9XN84_NOCBR|nr:PPE domain-containing protein [Nocardia brasiliensis]QIS02303.1 PPE domain-containing protein [Nocardia brasiliensis]
MVEPPQAGFTGTIWEAVPAEQLAHELTTGPGAAPMAETGLAYAEFAAVLGEAGTEFRAILSAVGSAWGSDSSEDGLAQLAGLSTWFDSITGAATDIAALATEQAAAYELAKLGMPPVGELNAAVRSAEEMLHGGLLGAPLAGLFDLAERQVDALGEQAAQVMRTYEAAGSKLAVPWQLEQAPAVSAGANLLAEQARRAAGTPAAPEPAATPVPAEVGYAPAVSVDLSALDLTPPPTVPVGGESLVLTALPQPGAFLTPVPTTPGTLPVATATPAALPPPVVSPAATAASSAPTPGSRAAAAEAGEIGEQIVVDAGFATAPAVLGATSAAAGVGGGTAPAAAGSTAAPAATGGAAAVFPRPEAR